jgi:hypothetical protein
MGLEVTPKFKQVYPTKNERWKLANVGTLYVKTNLNKNISSDTMT